MKLDSSEWYRKLSFPKVPWEIGVCEVNLDLILFTDL